MPITSIYRDFNDLPNIVRVVSSDNLAAVGAANYLTTQVAVLTALNSGEWVWLPSDMAEVAASDGTALYTVSADLTSLNIYPTATTPASLPVNEIFVGNVSNIPTAVAMSGDATIVASGALTIAAGAINTGKIAAGGVALANLAAGITPSHVIKFGGQHTTVGGAAAEAITITGALATDLAFVQMVAPGAGLVVVDAVMTLNTLTVTFSANPLTNTVINYQIIRAAA